MLKASYGLVIGKDIYNGKELIIKNKSLRILLSFSLQLLNKVCRLALAGVECSRVRIGEEVLIGFER